MNILRFTKVQDNICYSLLLTIWLLISYNIRDVRSEIYKVSEVPI